MEVDSPTQHSPIYVDIQAHYRVTFDNMKYFPIHKRWEIFVKLEDRKEERTVGETQISWPYEDPPHTITYDAEHGILHWENNDSLAFLPIRIPRRSVYDISEPPTSSINPKMLIRPSFSAVDGVKSDRASVLKNQRESGWKTLLLAKLPCSISKRDIRQITAFNPLFEERPTEEQQSQLLLNFFNSLNTFVAIRHLSPTLYTKLSKSSDSKILQQNKASVEVMGDVLQQNGVNVATSDNELQQNGVNIEITEDEFQQNGVNVEATDDGLQQNSTILPLSTSSLLKKGKRSRKQKLNREEEKLENTDIFDAVLQSSHFLLSDNSFIVLLRCCAQPDAAQLRRSIVTKNMPLNTALKKRVFENLENDVIVSLMEFYVAEFIIGAGSLGNEALIGKVLDLLLFITNGFNEKMLWKNQNEIYERLLPVWQMLKTTSTFVLSITKIVATSKFRDTIGELPAPQTDYRRRRIKFSCTEV